MTRPRGVNIVTKIRPDGSAPRQTKRASPLASRVCIVSPKGSSERESGVSEAKTVFLEVGRSLGRIPLVLH